MEYLMPRWTARSSKGGRTETGTETGTARAGRWGCNEGGNGESESGSKRVGKQGPGWKRSPLVEDVSEYWEVYEGGGAD